MVLWWVGNAILLLVVVPVLVALLNRVLAALERIRGAADPFLNSCWMSSMQSAVPRMRRLTTVAVRRTQRSAPRVTARCASARTRSSEPSAGPMRWSESRRVICAVIDRIVRRSS